MVVTELKGEKYKIIGGQELIKSWNAFWDDEVVPYKINISIKNLLEVHGIKYWGPDSKDPQNFKILFTNEQKMLFWILKWL